MNEPYIVVRGNPIDGFHYIGPFKSFDDAHAYAEDCEETWWIAPLEEE